MGALYLVVLAERMAATGLTYARFTGRIAHGFAFLGYHLTPTTLAPAAKTIEHRVQQLAQLYEQGAALTRIGRYVHNGWRWLCSGVAGIMAAGAPAAAWPQLLQRLPACVAVPLAAALSPMAMDLAID